MSTSPYAFVRLVEPDNAANFDRYGIWRRLGASATFNLAGESPVAGSSVDFKQLSEWSLRFRILGDRSTRSAGFTRRWNQVVGPKVQARLNALTGAIRITIDSTPALRTAADDASQRLTASISSYFTSSDGGSADDRDAALTQLILSALRESIYKPVSSGALPLTRPVNQAIAQAVDQLVTTHASCLSHRKRWGASSTSWTSLCC